jgi:hypothetical protein
VQAVWQGDGEKATGENTVGLAKEKQIRSVKAPDAV